MSAHSETEVATAGADAALVLLTERETAKILHHSPKSLERWRAGGTGPKFVRVGRKPLYRLVDVTAWLDEHSASSTSEPYRAKRHPNG